MVGAFFPRKDYDTFIRAALLLVQQRPSVSFIAIGSGPDWDRCLKSIPSEYAHRILLPGQMDHIESVVNIFDIGVLATNESVHGEGISNAILEYMALGKPVVATEGGGTAEIVKDGKTGLLVPTGSPKLLADNIGYLLDHPNEAKSMGAKGRDRMIQDFSLDKMTQEFCTLYESVLRHTEPPVADSNVKNIAADKVIDTTSAK